MEGGRHRVVQTKECQVSGLSRLGERLRSMTAGTKADVPSGPDETVAALPATGPSRGAHLATEASSRGGAEAPERAPAASGDRPAPGSSSSSASARPTTSKLLPALVGLAAMGISLWMMTAYASFIGPIFLALNLMITAYPVYRLLRRVRVPGFLAAMAAATAVFALLLLFIYGMYWSVEAMVVKLPEYSEQFQSLYQQATALAERLGLSPEALNEAYKRINPSSLAGLASSLLSDVGSITSMVVVVVTALIFMTMDTPGMDDRLELARHQHGGFVDALTAFAEGIRRYWVVTTVFGLIVAVLDGAVLVGLGVPLAMVWAIFSFLTNYIPNIGFVIGLIPPALLALFDSGPKTAIAVVVAYSVLNFVVQSIIQPKFAGDAVGLTPTLSFISLLLWTAVLGPLGALLALPMSLLVKALLIDPDPNTRWVNALISSRPQDAIDPQPVHETEGAASA